MNKKEVMEFLLLDEKQLDWLEDDYLRLHKENIERVSRSKRYEKWYVEALKEWKEKRNRYIPPYPLESKAKI
ncbi:hypothetical protein C4D40_00490 [Clostridium perfringens]